MHNNLVECFSTQQFHVSFMQTIQGVIRYCQGLFRHESNSFNFFFFFFFAHIQFAIALSVASAAEKAAKNTTAGVTSTKDSREKRNLNHFGNFGASRRNDGYNYQPSGYSKSIEPAMRKINFLRTSSFPLH